MSSFIHIRIIPHNKKLIEKNKNKNKNILNQLINKNQKSTYIHTYLLKCDKQNKIDCCSNSTQLTIANLSAIFTTQMSKKSVLFLFYQYFLLMTKGFFLKRRKRKRKRKKRKREYLRWELSAESFADENGVSMHELPKAILNTLYQYCFHHFYPTIYSSSCSFFFFKNQQKTNTKTKTHQI